MDLVVDWAQVFTIGIPTLTAIVSWFLGHYLSERRELAARRRQIRVDVLRKSYMKLAMFVQRPGPQPEERLLDFEEFVAEIQLYGSARQVKLMHELVEEMKKPNQTVSFDAILQSLRDELRSELQLVPIADDVWWFRFGRPQAAIPAADGASQIAPENVG